MKSTSELPKELYYLDENFSVRSLRKYQLKDILNAHGITQPHNSTKLDLIQLFKDDILSKRDAIIEEYYKQKQQPDENKEPKEEALGRGHRVSRQSARLQDALETTLSTKNHVRAMKDKDGFVVPSLPADPKKKKTQPRFTAQDSFDEASDLDAHHEDGRTRKAVIPTTFKETPATVEEKEKPTTKKKTERQKKEGELSFNPEDSFASSDDEQVVQKALETKKARKRSPPKETEKPVIVEKGDKRKKKEKAKEEPVDDDDDSDYLADSDDTDEEEDDEDDDSVDEQEVNSLYRERFLPVEKLVASEHPMLTRAQRLAAAKQKAIQWKAKFKNVGLVIGSIYMAIALMGLLFTTYARQQNGYCESTLTADRDVSFFFSLLPSSCIPCPAHGTCTRGELQCDPLYERKQPFYNIGGILPIADECIHNSLVGKYVAKVEKRIKRQLATQQGQAVCKHLVTHPDTAPQDVPILRVLVKDVLTDVKETVEPYFKPEQVNEIIYIALAGVLEDPKVHYWEIDNEKYFGTSDTRYSLSCRLKRLYTSTPITVKLYILLFISALSAIYGASKDYQKNRLYKKKIDRLVKLTMDQLIEQYDHHTKEPQKYPSPALAVSQIRSSLLNVNNRDTITDWQKVVEKVQHHPHVRKSFQEVRGDPVEYWELTP